MLAYFNGEIRKKEDIRISPDDRGFLFADGVYEVILANNGKMFKAGLHFRRLTRSLRALSINMPDIDVLRNVGEKLLRENKLDHGSATVYIQITRGSAPRKHYFPAPAAPATVYVSVSPLDPPVREWNEGVRVILVPDNRWARCDIKSVSLLPNVMACQQAKENGAHEAIFVRDGAVTEGTHTSFCAVIDGQVLTYPESHYVLPGITRILVKELCRDLGIPFSYYPILLEELDGASECMILGTTANVMPVVRIDDRAVGDGRPGPVTKQLQEALEEQIRNN